MNLGSPKQLQQVLFEELGLPKTKKIKTGYTTDADALQDLYAKTEHPFLEHLLRHRDVVAAEDGRRLADPDGRRRRRIHTTFNQLVAATGRLSSTDPNLQNIPVRTIEGREIRKAFVVGAGLRVADDGRLLADRDADHGAPVSRRGPDRGVHVGGGPAHVRRRDGVRRSRSTQVEPEQRRRIKAMSYGLAYGLSAFGLAAQLGITPEEAQEQMEAYFSRFGGVRDYLTASSTRPARTATPRRSSAAAATCPT